MLVKIDSHEYPALVYQADWAIVYYTLISLRIKGIWFPALGSDLRRGLWTMVDFFMISLGSTASSNSKARIRVNNRAFILKEANVSAMQSIELYSPKK